MERINWLDKRMSEKFEMVFVDEIRPDCDKSVEHRILVAANQRPHNKKGQIFLEMYVRVSDA
jgi:hypothetical protein